MNKNELSKDTLISYFVEGCKEKKMENRNGARKIWFRKKTLEPIKYSDIEKILTSLSSRFGWTKIFEEKKIIGLKEVIHRFHLSLEDK